ncbi:Putative ribonuclease H protein At1g65750 [Linum perenne]
MKVVWNLLNKPDELWARTLISKYLIRNDIRFTLRMNSGFSSLWKGVRKVWDHTLHGIQWSVKDKKKIKFWTDRWLDSGALLIDMAINNQGVNFSSTGSDFVLPNESWDLANLTACLPNEAVLQIIGMTLPRDCLGEDSFAWGLEPKGHFQLSLLTCELKTSRRPVKVEFGVRTVLKTWSMFLEVVNFHSKYGRFYFRKVLEELLLLLVFPTGGRMGLGRMEFVLPLVLQLGCSGEGGIGWSFKTITFQCLRLVVRLSSRSTFTRQAGRPFR